MRLQNKIALIGLLASTALIGTGFAAWTFTNAVQQKTNASATPQIVCAVELNDDFYLYNAADDSEIETLYLICDAPASGLNTLGGNGVYWSSKNDSTAYANKIESVYIKGTLNYSAYDIEDLASVTVTFSQGTNYSLTNGTYVEFAAATLPSAKVVTVANNAVVQSDDFALPLPSYKSNVNTTNFNKVADVANITEDLDDLVIAYQAEITAQTLKTE